jgi:hypothetical protein
VSRTEAKPAKRGKKPDTQLPRKYAGWDLFPSGIGDGEGTVERGTERFPR